jgi:hypothetical protein
MAELSLPASVDFSKKIPSLPDGVSSQLLSIQSTNGISFTENQVIQFDLPARSGLFLDGRSVFIRYRLEYTTGAGTASVIRRKPVYTTISKLDEFVGSTPVNSVYQYNQVANMYVDTNFSGSDVLGQAYAWGLEASTGWNDFDGCPLPLSQTNSYISVAAPLVCSALASCDKLIPTGLMAPWRIQLTVEQIANIATNTGGTSLTSFRIVQPELCIQSIDMGMAVENLVAASSPKLYLRTNGWANSTQNANSGTLGFNTYVFNHRYESIENLFFLTSSGTVSKALNLWGDSFNPIGNATTAGTIQFQIGQAMYPLLPINNSTGGRAAVLQYLRECVGQITDQRNTMSISFEAFNQFSDNVTPSTTNVPAKFIVGIPCSRLNAVSPYQVSSLMSGVSAASTPINVLVNNGTAYGQAMSLSLIAQYTELIEVDPVTRQITVVC